MGPKKNASSGKKKVSKTNKGRKKDNAVTTDVDLNIQEESNENLNSSNVGAGQSEDTHENNFRSAHFIEDDEEVSMSVSKDEERAIFPMEEDARGENDVTEDEAANSADDYSDQEEDNAMDASENQGIFEADSEIAFRRNGPGQQNSQNNNNARKKRKGNFDKEVQDEEELNEE